MELTPKQQDLYDRGIALFKLEDEAKCKAVYNKVKSTYDVELTEYTDEMLGALLNDVVYNPTESNLFTRYIMPPFSILDSRSGVWVSRRNILDAYLGSSLVGRAEGLAYGNTDWAKRGNQVVGAVRKDDNGTSRFDSVLCELLLKWFGFKGCKVFDPFAGGHVRGAMANLLGYQYTGIDLNPEQIIANKNRAAELGMEPDYMWICDDAINLEKYIKPNSQDLIFTCPPYGDLEQYTDNPQDLSNMEYSHFINAYAEVISKSLDTLKDNRFAVLVVGDFRDEKGFYRGFVADTINIFRRFGVRLYNEAILLNSVGTASMRAGNGFTNRKLAKIHQNVLVFYKGDPKAIQSIYTAVDNRLPIEQASQKSLF